MAAAAISTRLAGPADAGVVAAMMTALNENQGEDVPPIAPEALVRDGLGAEGAEFRVVLAEAEGRAVGYALYHVSYSTEYATPGFHVYDLWVEDGARSLGAGRALMADVARTAKAEGRTFLWWCSKPWNVEARDFYRRLGAIDEDIRAHAIFGDAFDRLAEGG